MKNRLTNFVFNIANNNMRGYIILASLLIASCNTPQAPAYKQLYKEVMSIHDEVMPKMSDIHRAKKRLRKLKDDHNIDLVNEQIKALDDADEAMMSWMHDFEKPNLGSLEKDLEYLTIEKDKINDVSQLMKGVIAEAEALIKTLEP